MHTLYPGLLHHRSVLVEHHLGTSNLAPGVSWGGILISQIAATEHKHVAICSVPDGVGWMQPVCCPSVVLVARVSTGPAF